MLELNKIYQGDSLEVIKTFPSESINCCVTSPPYWALRDYGCEGQLGLEPTFNEYINKLCDIFDEVKRVLKKDGTCWVNIGDSYGQNYRGSGLDNCSIKQSKNKGTIDFMNKTKHNKDLIEKNLCNIPARFSIEMQNRGWILRNVIIWYKPNCMPCSVKDRFTVDFEYVFFFVKNKSYWFEQQYEMLDKQTLERSKYNWTADNQKSSAYKNLNGLNRNESYAEYIDFENGRNKRTVWKVTTKPYKEAHFATYPKDLIEPMIKAGCPINGIVLDPFIGSGTTALVSLEQNKQYIGIELNPKYITLCNKRLERWKGQKRLIL